MKALFIGHGYIDVTFVTDYMPTGDEKYVGQDYAFGVGGNGVVAAFTLAKLGAGSKIRTDLMIQNAPDWLGEMLIERCKKAGMHLHTRPVKKSSLSLILPNDGKRAIVRCRDDAYLAPFPKVDVAEYQMLHLDGHQPDAALYYAKAAKKAGIPVSLDGGSFERDGIEDLLHFIDIAVVSERFCEQMGMPPQEVVRVLKGAYHITLPAVTLGEKGMIYLENGALHTQEALPVPLEHIKDSTGAGDIFHGAYVYHFLKHSQKTWAEHFNFARAASSLSIQRLGTEASIPTLEEVQALFSPQ